MKFERLKEDFINSYKKNNSDLAKYFSKLFIGEENNRIYRYLTKKAKKCRSRKDWENFEPYFDYGIRKFSNDNKEISAIFIPNNIDNNLYSVLQKYGLPQSNYEFQKSMLGFGFRGYYAGIPIYSTFLAQSPPHILFVGSKKYIKISFSELITDVCELDDSEKEQLKQKITGEKDLLPGHYVKIMIEEKIEIKILDRDDLLYLPIKIPEVIKVLS